MRKISILLILLLFIPTYAGAHSHLESSVPAEGEVVEEALAEVQLTFSGGIEEGSVMALVSEGETFEFTDMAVADNLLTGTVPEELPDGSYVVEWSVISEDGHPLDGTFAFELQKGNEEAEAEEPVAEEPATEEEEAGLEPNEAVSPFDNATTEQDAVGFSPFLVIVPILIAALAGGFFVIRRNR